MSGPNNNKSFTAASPSQLLLPNPVGGAVFIFGAKISLKNTKHLLFCILIRPMGRAVAPPPPPLATLLAWPNCGKKRECKMSFVCIWWWYYPTPSERWGRGGTPRRPNSRATPQGLDHRSRIEREEPKIDL